MALKMLGDYPAYNDYYHFTLSTKFRKKMFEKEQMRNRLYHIIAEIINTHERMELVDCTVAYDHVHVLLKSDMSPSDISQVLSGVSSRLLRKEFPELVRISPKALWGGKSCLPIKDQSHLNNCISYIHKHQPDNTKIDE
ncbi:MAG: IS200/IS605 family transposase [Lachnospiraceae bacterium]|nr:IS200/IS605 family transposase [Lachnospiraceae bacterium]